MFACTKLGGVLGTGPAYFSEMMQWSNRYLSSQALGFISAEILHAEANLCLSRERPSGWIIRNFAVSQTSKMALTSEEK